MWLDLTFSFILFAMGSSLIDEDQNLYLKKLNIECGIVNKDKIESTSSRIINAKPSIHTYSWMAQIKMKLYTDKKFISNNNEKFKIYDAAGTFISDKAVLTCGHCICHESDASPEMPFPYSCGTENPSGEMQENLNVKGKNEVNVFYGMRTLARVNDIPYKENLQAFVHKFERNKNIPKKGLKIIWNHGDIGIVITKKRIDLAKAKISPICLPSPDTFLIKSGLNVNFVGWGDRSEIEYDPNGRIKRHSCFTNVAREPSIQLYPKTGGLSFAECNFNKKENTFCLGGKEDPNGLAKNQVHTFSYRTRIEFNKNMVDYIVKDNYDQKCKTYMKVAEKKWIEANHNVRTDKTYEGTYI